MQERRDGYQSIADGMRGASRRVSLYTQTLLVKQVEGNTPKTCLMSNLSRDD
jgi:hypothetical protein